MGSRVMLGLLGSAIGFAATAWARRRDDARVALEREDGHFHRAYDAVRQDAAHHTPALVLYSGTLIFSDGAERREYPASAPASHLLKAAAHAPLGVYSLLLPLIQNAEPAELSLWVKTRLMDSRSNLERAELGLGQHGVQEGLSDAARADSVRVLGMTREFVDQTLARAHIDSASLAAFAHAIGPRLLQLTEYATELELAALHAATEAALHDMTSAQRASFEVVVAGVHQARDRSLPLQYFQKRLGEAPGEERRVTFAESVSGPSEARDLVGTRRLDRDIASAFFGNPARLQRDVLGDAAQHLLKRHAFERIHAPTSEADSAATQQRTCLSRRWSCDI